MMLWFVLALMTAGAIFSVLWPLARRTPLRTGTDVAVYRDQLDEIGRDRSAGLIGEREAEAARIEVSRRLIAAADAAKPAPAAGRQWRRRAAAVVALGLLPLGAASAIGNTIMTAVNPTMTRAAALRRKRRRARIHSCTGHVVNTRIPAHSNADRNGYSTRTQPTTTPPINNAMRIRCSITARGASGWSRRHRACSFHAHAIGGPSCRVWPPIFP